MTFSLIPAGPTFLSCPEDGVLRLRLSPALWIGSMHGSTYPLRSAAGLIRRLALGLALLSAVTLWAPTLLPGGGLMAQTADLITGQVTRSDGSPLAGARVEVFSLELETSRSALTGSDGRYTILFPDGGGAYVVRVSFIGKQDMAVTLVRQGEEELLLQNLAMRPQAIEIEGFQVEGRMTPPALAQSGDQTTELSQDLLNRLPLPDLDPTTLALLAAGVVATDFDSISGQMGFSVGGMSELLNEVTLDGISLGDGGLQIPEEGIRRTQVTTSTFDVSRGGFAGGLVALTSARGSNRPGGALNWRFDNDALQMNSAAVTNGFSRQNLGGSWGSALVQNQLFYNVSFQASRNRNHRFALDGTDPLAAQRSGVVPDSIIRFLDILGQDRVLPTAGLTGPYSQVSDDLRLSGRLDWNIQQGSTSSHSLTTRFNLNLADQDSTRISPLDLAERGGDTERNSLLAAVTLNSRFRTTWTHRLTASAGRTTNATLPFTEMPEGRVRVTSEWEDGTRDVRTLTFGGNRGMPSDLRSTDLQISNELSFLQPVGSQIHRLKVGGAFQRQETVSQSSTNLFGSYSYASLEDFEANLPDRFQRALTGTEFTTTRTDVGFFLGDTWRVSQPLELTMGVRWDYSGLEDRPDYNPAVEDVFGRRTDVRAGASMISPRLGFNYQLSQSGDGPPLPGMGRSISGGIGVFAGRAPVQVFTQAFRQTGLPSAEQQLICIGDAVPIPDWQALAGDPSLVPDLCADGGLGLPPAFSTRAPDVTLLGSSPSLPSSLRADLGYRTRVRDLLPINVRYTWSRGFGLWGARDINLDEDRFFVLADEGRPFFGDPSAIAARTGATSSVTSRVDQEFGNVMEVMTDLRSTSHQFSGQAFGSLGANTRVVASYTLGWTRDEGSAGGGTGRFAGGGGSLFSPTAGSPNDRDWAPSSNDRRHTVNLNVSRALRPSLEVSVSGRLSSGVPFTPLVDRDINGDGLRNDRAFIFDPAVVTDPALAQGMETLLASAPSRIADCLTDQMGGIAGRNSCRNGWTQSLSARVGFRPELPGLDRRMTISVDAVNILTGMDQLVNGRDNMRGWGDGARAEPVLLRVTGFDEDRRGFTYEVNEAFGQTRRGANALRAPFGLTISARVALGQVRGGTSRGFGGGGGWAGAGGMAGADMAAIRERIVQAMAEGGTEGRPGGEPGAEGQAGRGGGLAAMLGAAGVNPLTLLDRSLANPVQVILELEDDLGLSAEQTQQIQVISTELQELLDNRRERLGRRFDGVAPADAMALFQEIQPELREGREEMQAAMTRVQGVLSAEQWQRVPAPVRQGWGGAGLRGGGPEGGQPRRRPPGQP